MSDQQSRSEFEAWYVARQRLHGYGNFQIDSEFVGRMPSGRYRSLPLEDAWQAWQTSRLAALEEAAKVCEASIDRREAKRTEDRIRAAIATKETDDELRALRHASSVGLHNGALERAAAAIRTLAQPLESKP